MAAYTNAEKVRNLLARNADQISRTAASMGDDQIEAAIVQGTDFVNGKLASRYKVPFDPDVPSLVGTLTEALAAYYADLTFRQGVDYDSELDPVYLRAKLAFKTLDDLHAGRMDIPGIPTDDGGGVVVGGATVVNQYAGQLFYPDDFDLYPSNQLRDPRIGWF
jgi:phage gp36-like protein